MIPAVLILWIIGVIKEPRRTQIFRATVYIWMKIWFLLTGCSLRIKGKEHFVKNQQYIITCNHNSFMDVPVTTPFIPGANKTIAKIEMSKIPLFGLIYKRGSVLVNRKSQESRKDSYTKMKEVLNLGMHMCIYPEGTRNKTNKPLTEFHDGAFRLAAETGTPIMPTILFNTKKVLPPDKGFYFMPASLQMHFLPPVHVAKGDDYLALKEKVHRTMENYFLENKPKV